jgi:hypothetical protein
VEAKFSAPVQTGPGDHPSAYTLGTGAFPGVKRPGIDAEHLPHLAPRLKKEYRHISTPRLCVHDRIYGALYLHMYIYIHNSRERKKERKKEEKYSNTYKNTERPIQFSKLGTGFRERLEQSRRTGW